MKSIVDVVRKECARTLARAWNIIRRGTLGAAASSDFTGKIAGAGDDSFEGVELWQHFGLRSRAPIKTEVLIASPYGRGEGAIICAEHNRAHVPACAEGETVLYASKTGAVQGAVRVKPTGAVNVVPGTAQTIDLGADGTSLDFVLKGTTFVAAFATFCVAVGLAETAWTASSKLPADVVIWVNAVAAAHKALATACGPTGSVFLSTVAKVS